jgi:O-antigen/teichoic acid export membrane protein
LLNNLKSTVKNSIIYSLGNITTKIIGLVLLPIYTKHLTVTDYGILGIVEITSQLLIAVFGLSLYRAFNRWYWDKEFKNKQRSIFFTSLVFLFFIAILMFICFYSISEKLSFLLFDSVEYKYLFNLMMISAGLQIVVMMISALMRIQVKSALYTFTNVIKLIITLLITIYFIAYLKKNVEGIYEAQIIGFTIYILILAKYVLSNIKIKFELKILKGMLAFSFPLMLASISGVLLTIADRYCLRFLDNLSTVGSYSLGYKISNTIKIFVIRSGQMAISPVIYKLMDAPNNKRFYAKIMTYFTFVVMICVIGMSLFGKEVIKFLVKNHDFWDAYKIIPIISFSLLFGMLKDTAMIGINILKKTQILASVIIIMSVFNVVLNIILIPYLHSMGAAIATLITQFVFFIVIYKYSQKFYYIPFEINKIVKMILVGTILIVLSLFVKESSLLIRILIKLILIIAFPIILYFMNFYEDIELLRIKQSWQKWRNPRKWKKK